MGWFSDNWKNAFVEAPWKSAWKSGGALFQKREGQPFVQGTARNLGHAFFGDKAANEFEQQYLGDYQNPNGGAQTRHPVAKSPNSNPGTGFDSLTSIDPQAAAAAVPGTPNVAPGGSAGGQERNPRLDEMLRRLAMSQAQGGRTGGMTGLMTQPKVGP